MGVTWGDQSRCYFTEQIINILFYKREIKCEQQP